MFRARGADAPPILTGGWAAAGCVWTRVMSLSKHEKVLFNKNLENWNNIDTISAVYDYRLPP